MLIKCPECELQISDKAKSCPHCGFPMVQFVSVEDESEQQAKKKRRRGCKRRRLPNGFGQISEIKGLRKPFRAMVSDGKKENGRPIVQLLKPVSYFETYNEAYEALLQHHKNPYDEEKDITIGELYNRWSEEHFKLLKSPTSVQNIRSMWKHCTELEWWRVADTRSIRLKGFLSNLDTTNGNKRAILSILCRMFDYAVEHEIVDQNYARHINTRGLIDTTRNLDAHMAYTDDEMRLLWKYKGTDVLIDMLLVQCYTGMRPQELCCIKLENIHLDERYMIGGMKTAAGRNRKIPIHDRILPIVTEWTERSIAAGSETLFEGTTYNNLRYRFREAVKAIGMSPAHKPHDGRVQFITSAKKAGIEEYTIKLIVGHAISDITERIYTKRNVSWLVSEVNKIP